MQFKCKYTVYLSKTFLFQAIQFSQTVQILTIQFSISMQFYLTHRWDPIRCYHTGQSEPGSNGNEGVLRISQSSCITGTSPSDCLVSYLGHSLVGSYPSAEVQSVYSPAPANLAKNETEKCSYGVDRLQKGLWNGTENWIIDCLKMYISVKVIKFITETMKNWKAKLTRGKKHLLRWKSREIYSREMRCHHYYL